MAMTTSTPIKRAIVKKLRASSAGAASTGGIHWRIAPEKAQYPHLKVSRAAGAYPRADWDTVDIQSLWDIVAISENSVEAENLDALVTEALNEADLEVDGQTTLLCQRVGDVPDDEDTNAEGARIFQMGGTYRVWTYQPR